MSDRRLIVTGARGFLPHRRRVPGCGATLRPKPGDCCVFCPFGSVPCPPIRVARAPRR